MDKLRHIGDEEYTLHSHEKREKRSDHDHIHPSQAQPEGKQQSGGEHGYRHGQSVGRLYMA